MIAPHETRSCEITVRASPDVVWALVSDLPRMGRFSPENTGGWWLPGVRGPAVGAKFLGTNRNGWRRWASVATVVESDPGRRFTFDVAVHRMRISRWSYVLEPTPEGTLVRETWTFRGPPALLWIGPAVTGRVNRVEFVTHSMNTTLKRLRDEAERS